MLLTASLVRANSVVDADWAQWAFLPEHERAGIAPYCPGGFIAPVLPNQSQGETRFTFNRAQTENNEILQLEGDVHIYNERAISASDQAQFNQSTGQGTLTGNVLLRNREMGISGAQADIDINTYQTLVNNAEFALYGPDIRGTADIMERPDEQFYTAENLSFTRCAPGNNAWRLNSKRLRVDHVEGVAYAWGSRLDIQKVPVLYIPYISFPIYNQAHTGFLTPTFGSGARIPYYIHLAPNYDDTITVDYLRDGGVFISNEFRFLTEHHNGINQLDYQFIQPADQMDENIDARWAIRHQQSGQLGFIGYDFSTRWVSDENVDIALNPGTTEQVDFQTLDFSLNTLSGGFSHKVAWSYEEPVVDSDELFSTFDTVLSTKKGALSASLTYQTETEFDADTNPASESNYSLIKQPELVINYQHTLSPSGITFKEQTRAALFARDFTSENLTNLTTSNLNLATQTQRYHLAGTVEKKFTNDLGYFKPSLKLTGTSYVLTNNEGYDIQGELGSDSFTHTSARLTLDQGLTLTQQSEQAEHTFKPRLFYAFVPLSEQEAPILEGEFNSSFSLFTGSRFSSVDRVGDMSRLSAGLSYEYAPFKTQHSVFSASLKKGIKLSQERLTASGVNDVDPNWAPEYSDWFASATWQPNKQLALKASLEIDHDEQALNEYEASARFQPRTGFFAELSLGQRTEDRDDVDVLVNDIKASAYFPIKENIALITYAKFETLDNDSPRLDDYKTAETLFGIDYDSCCWNIRVAALNVSIDEGTDSTSLFPNDTETSYYVEFTLKGIGGGNGNIETILNNLDFGYSGKPFNYR